VERDHHLAAFCEALPELRQQARQAGQSRLLADVLKRIRAGDSVADQLARLGVAEGPLRDGGYKELDGLAGNCFAEVYECPAARCARSVPREPGGPLPAQRCWLQDEPLVRRRA
jgi:hypothetical protein